MRLSGLTLLAGIAVSAIAVTPSPAQDRVEVHRTVTTTATRTGPNWHHRVHRKKVCRTRWYQHERVKRCWWRRY